MDNHKNSNINNKSSNMNTHTHTEREREREREREQTQPKSNILLYFSLIIGAIILIPLLIYLIKRKKR